MNRRFALMIALGSLALLASGCSGDTDDAVTPGPTESPGVSDPRTDETPPDAPSEAPTPPEPTIEPALPGIVPSNWEYVDPSEAGIVESSADEVIGAWKLENGDVASIVVVPNTTGTTDPDEYYSMYFGDSDESGDQSITHEARTTDAGVPTSVVTIAPAGGLGGDAQVFIFVIEDDVVTSGIISTSPETITAADTALWDVMRVLSSP